MKYKNVIEYELNKLLAQFNRTHSFKFKDLQGRGYFKCSCGASGQMWENSEEAKQEFNKHVKHYEMQANLAKIALAAIEIRKLPVYDKLGNT